MSGSNLDVISMMATTWTNNYAFITSHNFNSRIVEYNKKMYFQIQFVRKLYQNLLNFYGFNVILRCDLFVLSKISKISNLNNKNLFGQKM